MRGPLIIRKCFDLGLYSCRTHVDKRVCTYPFTPLWYMLKQSSVRFIVLSD